MRLSPLTILILCPDSLTFLPSAPSSIISCLTPSCIPTCSYVFFVMMKKLPKKYAAFFFGLLTFIAENLVCKNVDIIGSDILVKKSNVSNLGIADNASNCKLSRCDTDNEITCFACFVSASVNRSSSPVACLYPSMHAQFLPIHPSGFEFAETCMTLEFFFE